MQIDFELVEDEIFQLTRLMRGVTFVDSLS